MRETLHILSLSTMLAMTLIVFLTFMSAYISPSKSTYVLVNNMGEADIEFVLMTLLLLLNAATTLTLSKSIYVGRREAGILRKIRFLKRNKAYVRELSQAQKQFEIVYEN
ncbi:MAG TPA: hypothetical protein VI968_03640 [archaeon]|nr:hypothetical protein [archaeon]